jgi:trimeric autotransporter adhesin
MVNALLGASLLGSGNTRSSGVRPFDFSILATPIQSNPANLIAPRSFTTERVEAPWQNASEPPELRTRLADARGQSPFINPRAPEIERAGEDPDIRSSFTLYRAIDRLKTLAEASAKLTLTDRERTQLQEKFKSGLEEVKTYLSTAQSDKLDFLYGSKKSRIESLGVRKPPVNFDGKPVTPANNRAAVLDGVTGAETITISLTRGNVTETVIANFANFTGAPTLDQVADEINRAIGSITITGANGPIPKYGSKVEVYRDDEGKWGLRFKGLSSETVSFTDPNAEPSVFLAGTITPPAPSLLKPSIPVGQLMRFDWTADGFVRGFNQTVAGIDQAATEQAKAVYDAEKAAAKPGTPDAEKKPPGPVSASTETRATVVDSQGFVYALSTSDGDFDAELGQGVKDVVLQKFGTDGSLIYSRVLAAGGETEGFALTVDADDNLIIAGRTDGRWTSGDAFEGTDAFVAKYNAAGAELFRKQFDTLGTDTIRAVSVDATGAIFVAGTVSGGLSGAAPSIGGQDGFLAKLNSETGAREQVTRFGSTGADDISAITVAPDGAIFVASTENGNGYVRQFSAADLTIAPNNLTLGTLNGGKVTSLAFDAAGGRLIVGGSTFSNIAGSATNSRSDGEDGFVAALNYSAGALSTGTVTYLGGTGRDAVSGVRVVGDAIYAAGTTSSVLGTQRRGLVDAFVSRIDGTTGAISGTAQVGQPGQTSAAPALAVSANGPGVLDKIGLRSGVLSPTIALDLESATGVQKDDFFFVQADEGVRRRIKIDAGETMESLARKIKRALPLAIEAVALPSSTKGTRLQLRAIEGREIQLIAGTGDKDALSKLGLSPMKLLDDKALFNLDREETPRNQVAEQKPGGVFALDLKDTLGISDKDSAGLALKALETAVGTVQRGFRSLYFDPLRAQAAQEARLRQGTVPPALQAQLANYQDALRRLNGGF